MIKPVRISNLTGSDLLFGGYPVPAHGSLRMPYAEYMSIVSGMSQVSRSGLFAEVVDITRSSVSVKDFGAKGDGFSDDTYAVQSAIDYAAECGGGVVEVPIGVYPISHVTVLGNVSVLGESRADSVFKAILPSSDAIFSIEGSSASVSRVRFVM